VSSPDACADKSMFPYLSKSACYAKRFISVFERAGKPNY
jgi:hypothetical protein